MSRHTPGPWSVGREYGAEQLRPEIQILRKVTYVEGVEPTTYLVGRVTYPTTTGNTVGAEERRSNARLIASAPDMYDVLAYAVDNPEFNPETFDKLARAALAKANGGEL